MKRSFIIFLAAAVITLCSASFAHARQFSSMTFDVPSGWTATETDSQTVTLTTSSNSDIIILHIAPLGTSTLQSVANTYHDRLNDSREITAHNAGWYSFLNYTQPTSSSSRGTPFNNYFFAHSYKSKVPEGYYYWVSYTLNGDAFDAWLYTVDDTIEFHPSSAPSSNNNTTAAHQVFSRMELDVPSGWTAEEDSTGLVSVRSSEGLIMFSVGKSGTKSLSAIASETHDSLTGTKTEVAWHENGYYYFELTNVNNVRFVVYIDDHSTYSRINSGEYCVQVRTINEASRNAFQSMWNTITFRSWSDNSGTGTGTDNPNSGGNTTIINNYYGTPSDGNTNINIEVNPDIKVDNNNNNNNNQNQDQDNNQNQNNSQNQNQTDNNNNSQGQRTDGQGGDDGGLVSELFGDAASGGGGCNSGAGAVMLLLVAFVLKKK